MRCFVFLGKRHDKFMEIGHFPNVSFYNFCWLHMQNVKFIHMHGECTWNSYIKFTLRIPFQRCVLLRWWQSFENGSRKIDNYLQRVEVKQTSISIETNGSLVLKSRTGDRSGNCNNQHSELSRICFLTRPLYIKHRYFIDTVCRHQ